MLNLMKLKKEKADNKEAAAAGKPRVTAGEIRMRKDWAELNVADIGTVKLHQEGNLMDFDVCVLPTFGPYRGGAFTFEFHVSPNYPHEAPKVKCKTKLYHPNIDLDGNVCLNVLREDWKPVLNINTIIIGLNHLFSEPNPNDPLNKEAAKMMQQDPRRFDKAVRNSVERGEVIDGVWFPPCSAQA